MSFPQAGANGEASVTQVEETFAQAIGRQPPVGGGGRKRVDGHRADSVGDAQQRGDRQTAGRHLHKFQPKGVDGKPSKQAISDSAVSETWGGQITKKALIALAVFLVLVTIYITLRYERYMALAALAALGFDLITTAGVYSLVGFEVTPGNGDRPADHPRVLALRHRHRVRQGRGEHQGLRTHHQANVRRAGQPRHQPDLHALDQHQPDLDHAGAVADRCGGLAAGRRHAQGPRAGPVGRHPGRHLLVDLLRDTTAGDACGSGPIWSAPTRDGCSAAASRAAAPSEPPADVVGESARCRSRRPSALRPRPTSPHREPVRCGRGGPPASGNDRSRWL